MSSDKQVLLEREMREHGLSRYQVRPQLRLQKVPILR